MATDTLTPIVASNVRQLMEAAGENPNSLSRATGITRSLIITRLLGKTSWKTSELAIIAGHYNTTPDALCTPQVDAA